MSFFKILHSKPLIYINFESSIKFLTSLILNQNFCSPKSIRMFRVQSSTAQNKYISKKYRYARGTQLINHSIMSKVNKNSRMKQIIMSVYNVSYRLKPSRPCRLIKVIYHKIFSSTYLDSKLKKIL